jgi:2-O-methyltransferase
MNRLLMRASLAISKPELVLRKLRGKDIVEIELHEIARYLTDSPVILEAGACDGSDTIKFAQYWPGATIHAFEPVPELFAETKGRTSHLPKVRCYPIALSEHTGSATLHVSEGGNRGDSSSLLAPAEHLTEYRNIRFDRSIVVQTMTIEDWVHTEGIDQIDFMWLDMQGMELPTLKAAGAVLGTTRAICMEVARMELYAGCAMYDEIVSWMRSQGFRPAIDRVTFSSGNILFVRS